ncbi:inosine monophosphate dehydrogenase [Calocera viscosa TUFC12733]|uniref:Inosine monophosphate dehydrogenase n=1 Tax=Calocera viscosa (strain TUFC12733) TaxID=1330018 RepID=A0A167IRB7_CALVF|nr:inosine monophosphate dehydrogenase [Calocera viscosa TUFC12733]
MPTVQRITTPFTRLLSLRTPLVGGAMNTVSGPALATAVSLSGGFGFWAVDVRSSLPEFKTDLLRAREQLSTPPNEPVHLGLGALAWMLEPEHSPVRDMLEHGLREAPGVRAVWLSFGEDLGKWVRWVRGLDGERGDGRKTLLFIQVGTLEQALEAQQIGADVVVLQGSEAGGHSWEAATSTSALIAQALAHLPTPHPHILAAGGVGSGAQAAAYLTLGAEGVVVGTLLAATKESLFPQASKEALLHAGPGSTRRTTLWDRVQGRPWPKGVTGRALENALVEDEREGASVKEMRERVKRSGGERTIVFAGEGVGGVKAVLPAKVVIERLHSETVDALKTAHSLLQEPGSPGLSSRL